jgi:P27 family predicted phage terminase small subunit
MAKKKRAPKNLSRESQRWWRKIVDEYNIGDSGGLAILQIMCEAFDRMREAQKILETEGPTITDRFGQIKAHPLCAVERDARSQVLQSIKSLNLDLEPLKEIGRPPGS